MVTEYVSYEVCKHQLEKRSIGFYSCPCGHIRSYPFVSVQNLIGYYKFERGADKKQALELIIETYTKIGNNKTLIEVARERLAREFA